MWPGGLVVAMPGARSRIKIKLFSGGKKQTTACTAGVHTERRALANLGAGPCSIHAVPRVE